MPGWKFWEKAEVQAETPAAPEVAGRFNVRPRTDLVGGALPSDREAAAKVSALRKRRDAVLFDVEQATLAGESENPWLERVATIDAALRSVEADLARLSIHRTGPGGIELPGTPVVIDDVALVPSPRVVIRIGATELVYEEELDWSERGHQLARTDLHLESGNISELVPSNLDSTESDELAAVLRDSLFSLATDARDRALAEQPPPHRMTLRELAQPDPTSGGWVDINAMSPRRWAHANRLAGLTAELERLRTERDRELQEMARWRERLPVARRRLRDVDEQIATVLGGGRR